MRRRVQRVIDGDTFKVRTRVNGSQYVRIAGVNAPEKWQFGYAAAKERLRKQVQSKVVTLQSVGRSYDRVVARVRCKRRLIR